MSSEGEMNPVTCAREVEEKVGSEDLKADLETFARLMELAYEKKDVHLLILAHCIIHDLDYWVLNNEMFESRDYWGATITLEDKEDNSVKQLLENWPEYKEIILSDGSAVEVDDTGGIIGDFSANIAT